MARTSLAAVALWLSAPAARAQDATFLTRVYDVGPLVFRETRFTPQQLRGPWGKPNDQAAATDVGADESYSFLEIADLVTTLKEATDPAYWEREGVEVRPEDTGYLAIRCEAEMHDRVAASLERMRNVQLEQIVVELHLLPGNCLREQDTRAILSAKELDALLRRADAHPMLSERARLGSSIVLQSLQSRGLVSAVAMAASQSVALPDPVAGSQDSGESWRVSTVRAPEGVLVAIEGASCQALGEPRAATAAAGKGGETHVAIQLGRSRIAVHAAQALLKDGEGLLFGSNAADSMACCLRIRRPHPARAFGTIEEKGAELPQLHLQSYPISHLVTGPRPAGAPLPTPRTPGEMSLFPENDTEPQPALVDAGRLQELLKVAITPDKWDGNPFTMNIQAGVLYIRADKETHDAVSQKLTELGALVGRRFSVEIRYDRVTAKALPPDADSVADLLADKLTKACVGVAGKRGGLAIGAGTWTSIVSDYKPVLGAEAAAAEPVVSSVFEGASATAEVQPASAKQVLLRCRFKASELASPIAPFDLGDNRFGPIDQAKQNFFTCNAVPMLDLDQWTLIHLSPVPDSTDHFAIVVRVREL